MQQVWWSSKDGTVTDGNKQAYDAACNKIRKAVEGKFNVQLVSTLKQWLIFHCAFSVQKRTLKYLVSIAEVEEIQVSILRLLLMANDYPTYQESSRALFLSKFRTFLKEHAPGSRVRMRIGLANAFGLKFICRSQLVWARITSSSYFTYLYFLFSCLFSCLILQHQLLKL